MTRPAFLPRRAVALLGAAAVYAFASGAAALDMVETPVLMHPVGEGQLPPVAERAPAEPLIVDIEGKGRRVGQHGGTIRTIVGRAKDVRMMVVYGYARLVGYDEHYNLTPDILRDVEEEEGRVFTLHLRKGHKWSDGHPFTTEDIRYWWEDVANNEELSPGGVPALMLVNGEPPEVTVIDETTIRFAWSAANPSFLPALAQARPPFIYRPAHFMKKYHVKYGDAAEIAAMVEKSKVRGWAQLHNRLDNMYDFDNPDLPTLQPWVNTSPKGAQRYVMRRNPYFHRFDMDGRQLPYIDGVEMTVAAGGLIPAKVNVGESDLQARGLSFADAPVLKKGEEGGGYVTHLWKSGVASEIALYPNLTYEDPAWREVLRDVRFRRALSLAIDRAIINKSLFFGLAQASANSALPESPFYDEANTTAWAQFDPAEANRLLDEMGLDQRAGDGTRLLPDGRPVEIVVETAGERPEEADALELVAETWRDIGVKLIYRPLDRDILRNRAYAGQSMMPVWFGWNNGLPTPDASPQELAPVDQANFSWPRWGQYFQTSGGSGEAPDTPEGKRLMELFDQWTSAKSDEERSEIWREMLAIHADQVFVIGLVNQAPQPVVASKQLRNVPEKGLYAWDPGAHFGVHRMDEFFFVK
jgi:peptide/nickel transport system substrate-binding protein